MRHIRSSTQRLRRRCHPVLKCHSFRIRIESVKPLRRSQRRRSVRFFLNGACRGTCHDIVRESVPDVLAFVRVVGAGDGGGAVVALDETDVAVGALFGVDAALVADLELDPGGWGLVSPLDAAFEGHVELDGDSVAGVDEGSHGGVFPGADAVDVRVEVECLRLVGFVSELDAGYKALEF